VRAARGRVCGRLRRHAAEAAWTREGATGAVAGAVVVLIAWGGRYEGAWDNDKKHGFGTYTWADGGRCVRHGRGVPGVSRGGAHAQRAGAWRDGSLRQDMTDAQVCGGATDGEASAVGSVAACAGPGLTG
jgi:hypothetical protein